VKARTDPEVLEVFSSFTALFPDMRIRKMFGFPCAFSPDHMFLYVYDDSLVLRLAEDDRAAFTTQYAAKPFAPKGGRGMREYTVVPRDLLCDPTRLRPWIERAHAFVSTLPPKPSKRHLEPSASRLKSSGFNSRVKAPRICSLPGSDL
jgi:TfoX/Sxy family transcriptional regulator of competence genes